MDDSRSSRLDVILNPPGEMLLGVLFPGEKVNRCLSIGKAVMHRLYSID